MYWDEEHLAFFLPKRKKSNEVLYLMVHSVIKIISALKKNDRSTADLTI